MVHGRYPFDDLEDEKSSDGDTFMSDKYREKYLNPYDRPYYVPRGSATPKLNRHEDEFNQTTRISRESLMAYSPEQGSYQDKYESDYYNKNYRIYSKERDPESSSVRVKAKPDEGLDPIERYNLLKYFNDRDAYKERKRPTARTKPMKTSSKPRGYRGRDVVYGKSKKSEEEGPVYHKQRKKKRVDYRTLLPQPDNDVDTRRKENDDDKDKSYGYVKDQHGNTYFKVY